MTAAEEVMTMVLQYEGVGGVVRVPKDLFDRLKKEDQDRQLRQSCGATPDYVFTNIVIGGFQVLPE